MKAAIRDVSFPERAGRPAARFLPVSSRSSARRQRGGSPGPVCAMGRSSHAIASADEAPPLETLLERAGAYVARYADTFRDVVAEEHYRQWWNDPNRSKSEVRTLRSDMVFAVVPGPLPWTMFRDVFEVDGRAVRDRQDRLERLFVDSPQTAAEQAQAILRESARHNVGPPPGEGGERTVNVPTLGLLFLQPENQKRLSIEKRAGGPSTVSRRVEIRFEEEASPTLIHDRDLNDVPARGRFWIDPSRGVVVRTEVEYNLEPESARAAASGVRLDPLPARARPRHLRPERDERDVAAGVQGSDRGHRPLLELPALSGHHRGERRSTGAFRDLCCIAGAG